MVDYQRLGVMQWVLLLSTAIQVPEALSGIKDVHLEA